MTIDGVLARLDGVRRTGRGFMSKCPAHMDKSPSLSIREGDRGLLIYCWAGCSLDAICHALDLDVADIFYDKPGIPSRHAPRPEPRRPTIRELETRVWCRAMALDLRALNVLDAARGLDVSDWTEADYDTAMRAACKAREDLRVAETLHALAASMRETLNPRRRVADEARSRVA